MAKLLTLELVTLVLLLLRVVLHTFDNVFELGEVANGRGFEKGVGMEMEEEEETGDARSGEEQPVAVGDMCWGTGGTKLEGAPVDTTASCDTLNLYA